MAFPVSGAFRVALSQDHRAVIRVDVCSPTGVVLATLSTVVGGNVDIDETRKIRRLLTLTVESQGRTVDSLIPRVSTDLLHSALSNELKVYRGIDFQDGSKPEMVPLGVFRMSKPKTKKTANGYELTINGMDRSAWVSRISWQAPFEVSGMNLATALQLGISSRVPGLKYNLAPTSYVMPDTVWGANLSTGSNDPWADFTLAANSGGCELFFDPVGVVTTTPLLNPLMQAATTSFVEGPNCTVNGFGSLIDESVEYNGVRVISTPAGSTVPLVGEAWITDPTSPVYYLGPWGQSPYTINTTLATTQAQVDEMAFAQLQLIYRAMDTIDFSCAPDPTLDAGDVITVKSPGMGIDDKYVFSAGVIPLDYKTAMTVTCRPRASVSIGTPPSPSGGGGFGGGAHTVAFSANGGTGSMSSETYSSATALTTNAFTRTGFTFANWNTAADGSGATYADGASYPFTVNATLYAQWVATGGGSGPSGFARPSVPGGMTEALWDDFLGTSLDSAYWGGNAYAYNGVSHAFTDGVFLSSHLVTLGDSILNLYGYQDPAGCAADTSLPSGLAASVLNWAGAGIQTIAAIDWKPGTRILTAMRCDSLDGLTAIALLFGRTHWPPEIDFVECGAPMTRFTTSALYGAGRSKVQKDTLTDGSLTFDLSAGWVVFGVEWTSSTIDYLVQLTPSGPLTVWKSITNPDNNTADPYSLVQKMFLALQLQTGDRGASPSPVNSPGITSSTPIKQQHDWVQVCVTP